MDTRSEFARLWDLYLPITAGACVVVLALVVFAVLRYRDRPDRRPAGRAEHTAGELILAGALTAIAAVLITVTLRAEARVDRTRAGGLRVEVTAFDWQWRFHYPQQHVTVVGTPTVRPTLVVPTGTRISFWLVSRDVIHSFFVPALRFKRDAFPGRATRFDLVVDRAGTFPGRCAEFCGLYHAGMEFEVRAVPPAQFGAALDQASRAA